MKKKIILLMLMLPISAYGSENIGTDTANYEAGAGYSTGNLFDHYELSGTANLPLTDLLGTNINGLLSNSDGKRHGRSRGIDSDGYLLNANFYLRKQETGKIGFSLIYAERESDFGGSTAGDNKTTTTGQALFGEYYLEKFTVGASRSYQENDRDFETYTTLLRAQWYVTDNSMVGIAQNRWRDENSYIAAIIYQPSFLDNNVSFTLDYYSSSNGGELDSIGLSMSYHFGTQVTLIDRDRKYR